MKRRVPMSGHQVRVPDIPRRTMSTSSLRVPRRPAMTLGLLLVACGGGSPPQSPAQGAEPSAAPAEVPAASSEPAAAGGAEPAKSSGAPDEKPAESEPGGTNEFKAVDTHTAKGTHGVEASKLAPTKTEALLKLVVVDKDKGPIPGIVVS